MCGKWDFLLHSNGSNFLPQFPVTSCSFFLGCGTLSIHIWVRSKGDAYTQSQTKRTVESCISLSNMTLPGSLDLDPGSQGKPMNSWCVSFGTECSTFTKQMKWIIFKWPKVRFSDSQISGKCSEKSVFCLLEIKTTWECLIECIGVKRIMQDDCQYVHDEVHIISYGLINNPEQWSINHPFQIGNMHCW